MIISQKEADAPNCVFSFVDFDQVSKSHMLIINLSTKFCYHRYIKLHVEGQTSDHVISVQTSTSPHQAGSHKPQLLKLFLCQIRPRLGSSNPSRPSQPLLVYSTRTERPYLIISAANYEVGGISRFELEGVAARVEGCAPSSAKNMTWEG